MAVDHNIYQYSSNYWELSQPILLFSVHAEAYMAVWQVETHKVKNKMPLP